MNIDKFNRDQEIAHEILTRIKTSLHAHEIVLPHEAVKLMEEAAVIDPVDQYQDEYQELLDENEEIYKKALEEAKEKVRRIMAGDINEIEELWQDFLDQLDVKEFIANMKALDGPEWLESNMKTLKRVAADYACYEADKAYGVVLKEDL